MIKFNIPPYVGNEIEYIEQAIQSGTICGDGEFTKKCNHWLEEQLHIQKAMLTTSCTHALEMAAILSDIQPGDEVIMPSYTFVSTANAMTLRGAKIVFVDIRPDTMNIDETLIKSAITHKTRAIMPVHYAGVACEMNVIMEIANNYNLFVIEDAAQAIMSEYKGEKCGTFGDFGCLSFHETKNISMGEGGSLLIKDSCFNEAAEIIREKGTNRSRFFRGEIDKYSWVGLGSSYLPSELNAAYLWAQCNSYPLISASRMKIWNQYYETLKELDRYIELPHIPEDCTHNAHMFYIKTKDLQERTDLIQHLKEKEIKAVFHYIPLHTAQAGKRYGIFHGEDKYTTKESQRLLRLPLYYHIEEEKVSYICDAIKQFYRKNM